MDQMGNPAGKEMKIAKYTAKDSVFTDLFGDSRYLFQLYQALHPEDRVTTEKDLSIVTIKNVLLDQSYNDLGFQAGEKLVMLLEAQSSWTPNILVRCLLYLAQTYQEHIERTKQNVYANKKLELPRAELYVIFTGDRKTHPEYLSLTEEFFDKRESSVEVRVKMIYDGEEGDIINQYVTFTKIYNEQVKLHGRSREAVLETIRICKDRNVLKEYLETREQEVVNIMMTLFDDEYIIKTYVESEKREAAKEAMKEAQSETAKKTARNLSEMGMSVENIAKAVSAPVKQVEEWLGLVTL